ncbi:MAG TPA: outer membrane protein assembly factor BamD [Chthoniobacteraceae bacterium]|jgi:outer membrane protein assembly factor BamD|nr:outer membrane protein assembly factor BamD [Chthoniobacteraceae bacterium]
MRKTHVLILLAAGLIILPCRWAGAEVEYQSGQGWSLTDLSGEQKAEATPEAQLGKAQKYEQAGDYHHAMVAYYLLTRKFPRSGAAPGAQLKAAEMAVKSGDLDRGYDYYNEYLTKYPKGDDFDNALQGMYDIGQKFLAGARRRLFGVKAFPSMARAQQVFENIVKVAPFSKWAPLAQFYVGQALEKQGKPDDAVAAYDEVISRYPTDPAAADAQYQIGYVYLVESRTAYDKTSALKAQEAFEDYLTRYPNSEKAAQTQDDLKAIQARENSNAVTVAKYYDKKKNYKAAVIYYNEVIKEQPGTPDAQAAAARITAIKALVGDAALDAGPEKPETGAKVQSDRRLQAQLDTSSRADYLGPPVAEPTPTPVPDQTAPPRPSLRSSPDDLGPAPEPPLPAQ